MYKCISNFLGSVRVCHWFMGRLNRSWCHKSQSRWYCFVTDHDQHANRDLDAEWSINYCWWQGSEKRLLKYQFRNTTGTMVKWSKLYFPKGGGSITAFNCVVLLGRTIVGGGDWCFDNLHGSHLKTLIMTSAQDVKTVSTTDDIPSRLPWPRQSVYTIKYYPLVIN